MMSQHAPVLTGDHHPGNGDIIGEHVGLGANGQTDDVTSRFDHVTTDAVPVG